MARGISYLVAALAIMLQTSCLKAPLPKPREPETINPETVTAFETAGATFGHLRMTLGQGIVFRPGPPPNDDTSAMPAFSFRVASKQPLPEVNVRFGVNFELTVPDGESIEALSNQTKLEGISTPGQRSTADWLPALLRFPNLTMLRVRCGRIDNTLDDAGISAIAQCKTIKYLDLAASMSAMDMRFAESMNQLEGLNLSFHPISLPDLRKLGQLEHLRLLLLDNCGINDDGVAQIASWKRITQLNLSRSPLTVEGFQRIAEMSYLTELCLDQVSSDSYSGMVHFGNLKSLRRLSVCQVFFSFAQRPLRSVTTLENLTHLSLADSHILDNEVIDQMVLMPKLEYLDVGRVHLNDGMVAKLKNAKSLKSMNIQGTDVTDAGLAMLAEMTTLEHIGLGAADQTDAGLMKLAGTSSLRRVDILGSRITPDAIERFRKASPTCVVQMQHWPRD